MSRPGSTTAPCGSRAMVASSFAVAGIEPVEPAAITGALLLRAARFRLDQAVAPLGRLDGAALGKKARASADARIAENRARAANSGRDRPGTSLSRLSHGTSRVVMSSISRARSSASAIAAAGVLATSGAPRSGVVGDSPRPRISLRERQPALQRIERFGKRQRRRALAISAKAISSSSMSPSGTMRGRIAASRPSRSRKTSRAGGRRAASAR